MSTQGVTFPLPLSRRLTDICRCSLDGEEGGEVGRVGGDDDQREEPPDAADYSGRRRLPTIATISTPAMLPIDRHARATSKYASKRPSRICMCLILDTYIQSGAEISGRTTGCGIKIYPSKM